MIARQRIFCSASGAVAMIVAGGTAADAACSGNNSPAGRAAMHPRVQANQDLLAAGEPFEKLTESAFTASPATLNQQIATAASPARASRPFKADHGQKLSEMHKAVANRDATAAYGAANAVLGLVDQLEQQFGETCDARP